MENISALILPQENEDLLKPFSKVEITSVICGMDLDKAPGSDGFSIHFYRACWRIIKKDLIRMIKIFQKKAKIDRGTNATLLALIPKETNPGSFTWLRLISLCNTSSKICSKSMTNRLKSLLHKVVSIIKEASSKEDISWTMLSLSKK